MKKKNFFFISGIVIMFILLIVLDNMVPKPLDWTPTFNDNDKRPYGKYLVSRLAQKLFEGDWEFLDSSFYQVYSESEYFFSDSLYGNYVSITDSWDEDEVSFKKLMEWVALGNNAFISAHYFPKEFMDSLKIRTDIKYMFNFQKIKGKDSGKELNFTNPMLKSKQDYKYFRALVYSVVTRFDTASTTVLGRYKDGDPNFISIKFGDGMFYINTASYMFTNYNMVIGKNYEYAEKALSYLDRNYFTAWDKSNSMQMEQPTTPFRFILLNTPLRWAFYTALFAVIMFILFRAKRQQRIIPVIKPLKNSTLEFAGTIGNLYLHKPDHHAMAEKKIRHFLELVRNKYHLQTNELDDNFTRKLSLKSGCDAGLIKSIILDINAVRVVSAISDETLVRLNKNIDNFYIRSNHGKYE